MPIGATIGSALIGGGASLLAANKETKAAKAATDTQTKMFEETRSDLAPFTGLGKGAATTLASLYGLPDASGKVTPPDYSPFYESPDYQFAKSEGIKAYDASAAAKGNLLSGGQAMDLGAYITNVAGQQYGNYVSRLMDLARIGESAGAQTGSIGANTAANIGNTQMAAGEAKASGIAGAANAATGGIENVLRILNQNKGYSGAYSGSIPINPITAGTRTELRGLY